MQIAIPYYRITRNKPISADQITYPGVHIKNSYSMTTVRGRNELCQFRFSFLGPFFQIWQFFVVLRKIGHIKLGTSV